MNFSIKKVIPNYNFIYKKIPYFLLLSLFFVNISFCFGSHIQGGSIFYEFIGEEPTGENKYMIFIESYVECTSDIISETAIGVFLEDSLITTLFIPLDSTEIIPSTYYDCISVPTACFLKLSYKTTIILPVKNESYFMVHQSCCRGAGISNIFNSGAVGYSYLVEISALSQSLKNSAPRIKKNPPLTICVNEEIDISFLEVDLENNQLVYEICSPLNISPNTGLSGLAPPPYPSVPFAVPEFSFQTPIGQNSIVSLDSNTGLLTIKPTMIGRFVIGICIKEYQNGQLLSTITRDILLNVDICTSRANIILENAIEISDGNLQLNFCGTNGDTLIINNQSTDINFINQFYWTFNLPNTIDTVNEWHPAIYFPEAGTYMGQLLLNPGEQCADTANLIINVNTHLFADFEVIYDTCIGGAVSFIDNSFSEGGEITIWDWNFGDSISSNEVNPMHLYQTPGLKESTLIVTNEFECKDTIVKVFEYLPAPPIIVVTPNTFAGCSPLTVFFENLSLPIDSTYDILWDFGNGDFSTMISPSYVYEDNGIYNIEISITSPIGCSIDTTFSQWIIVESPPVPAFRWQPDFISNLSPEITLLDFSEHAEVWEWNFNKMGESFEQYPTYISQDTGIQAITLKVTDKYGCQDSLTKWIEVIPEVTYFLPNAFTPNQDGKNEIYIGKGVLDGVTNFHMSIWNKWGDLVFKSNNSDLGWSGNNLRSGKPVPAGVYICQVKFMTNRKEEMKFQQSLVLFR